MIRFFRNLFLRLRFFGYAGLVVGVFILSFAFPFLFVVAQVLLLILLAGLLVDIIFVFNKNIKFDCVRQCNVIFSLGSDNQVSVDIHNKSGHVLDITLIDELPFQFQERYFRHSFKIGANGSRQIRYSLRPTLRGEYKFGNVLLYVGSLMGLVEKKIVCSQEQLVKVYPSVIEMKNMELKAFPKISNLYGIKKLRRIGHSYEFEQIKNYELGDDIRSINWKATGKRGYLMVNQYEDEKAQQIYCIIDKSRAMKMPFNNLSLLDYAINSTLSISNIALQKHDKAGLITFSDKLETRLAADRSQSNLKRILEALYNEEERKVEANYEALYLGVKNYVKGRSLVFLYTNFESHYAMERVLPILRKLNKLHLLVVIFFENSEIIDFSKKTVVNVEDIYNQTIAHKFLEEKIKIIYELKQFGIQTIYTRPEDLSLKTVNKYLELKARGLI